eukprot:Gb_19705 [translate_table: standard]
MLRALAQKWNIDSSASWNLTDPCTGPAVDTTDIRDPAINPAIKCDCKFNNGSICHIVQMKVYALDKTGELPEELANLTFLWDLAKIDFNTPVQQIDLILNTTENTLSADRQEYTALNSWRITPDRHAVQDINHPVTIESILPLSCNLTNFLISETQNWFMNSDLNKFPMDQLVNLWDIRGRNLAQNYLTGSLPDFLGNLTEMQYLSLGMNKFSGPVPKELGNLLEQLKKENNNCFLPMGFLYRSFSSNSLNGTLPPELGNLTLLQQLFHVHGVQLIMPLMYGKVMPF